MQFCSYAAIKYAVMYSTFYYVIVYKENFPVQFIHYCTFGLSITPKQTAVVASISMKFLY